MRRDRDLRDYLNDLALHARILQEIVAQLRFDTFEGLYEKQLAVARGFEILGEAARNLPQDFRDRYPEIPWNRIIGLQNRLAHEYFELSLPILWDTIHDDLPLLQEQIESIIREYNP